jgi:hypothetical protein
MNAWTIRVKVKGQIKGRVKSQSNVLSLSGSPNGSLVPVVGLLGFPRWLALGGLKGLA